MRMRGKYLKNGRIKKIALSTLLVLLTAIVALGLLFLVGIITPRFIIVSHNDVLHVEGVYPGEMYSYTVYVEIRNLHPDLTTVTVYCELIREDLTKMIKQQTISLDGEETKVIEFFFSNEDLRGGVPKQYKVYGE